MKWGCLKSNPFENANLIENKKKLTSSKGPDLDCDQVREILEYLKAKKETWRGHRLYAFTAIIVYAGLKTTEAFELTSSDFDFERRIIHIRSRNKFTDSRRNPTAYIVSILHDILMDWIPVHADGDSDIIAKLTGEVFTKEQGNRLRRLIGFFESHPVATIGIHMLQKEIGHLIKYGKRERH